MKISHTKKIFLSIFLLYGLLQTTLVYAQSPTVATTTCSNNFTTVVDIIEFVKCVISGALIPLLFAVAVGVFIWGVIQYLRNTTDPKKREEGRSFMIYGIVSLFVMISIWGLVGFLGNTFGVSTTFVPSLPQE